MLHLIATYAHMPKPLVVFGALFTIYAVFPILKTIKEGYLKGILSNIGFYLKKYHKLWLISLLAVFLLVYYVDLPIAQFCKSTYNIDVYTIFDFINSVGEGWFIVSVLFTLSILFESCKKNNYAIILKISYIAAIYAGIFNAVLKFLFNRERPSVELNPSKFFYFFISGDRNVIDLTYAYNSMPSGHTITIFAAIIPLILYVQSTVLRILFLGLGLVIAIARVYTMNHWVSDITVSVILGIIIGLSVYKANSYRVEV